MVHELIANCNCNNNQNNNDDINSNNQYPPHLLYQLRHANPLQAAALALSTRIHFPRPQRLETSDDHRSQLLDLLCSGAGIFGRIEHGGPKSGRRSRLLQEHDQIYETDELFWNQNEFEVIRCLRPCCGSIFWCQSCTGCKNALGSAGQRRTHPLGAVV